MLLIRKFQTLLRLNMTQLVFLPLVFILLGVMRLIILTLPFSLIAKIFLLPQQKIYVPTRINLAMNMSKSVTIMAKYTPWESKCLVQGLVIRLLLRLFAIPSIFYLGVAYAENNKFLSHAWVESSNITIIGQANSFNHFKIIQQFEDK